MKKLNYIFLFLALFLNSCASAQMGYSTKSKQAIKSYEEAMEMPRKRMNLETGRPDYETGIELLKKALQKDSKFVEAHQLIGEFYRLTGQSKEAVAHFKQALEIRPSENLNGQLFLDIGDLQIKNGEFQDAIKYFDLVLNNKNRSTPENVISTSKELRNIAEFNIEARKNPLNIEAKNIGKGINTRFPEYFPTITVDGKTMLFTREVPINGNEKARGQEDFFVSVLGSNNVWTKAQAMPRNINTPLNEGAPTISADGRTLIFVACADASEYDYGPNREGRGSCDLFITEKIGEKWTNPVNLPGFVNTPNWESQPSLSADGKTLYFIRRVGGKKGKRSDIFMSKRLENGTWGIAVPLPDNINSEKMESSVLIHPDGQTLYFASNGHLGLGGTDIFMSRKDPLGNWGDPINLGYPINTENNENSLLVSPDGEIAFFASDRPGGEGSLDIYYFEMPEELRPVKTTYFEGKVYDALTKKPLSGRFELIDLSNGEIIVESSADPVTGAFLLALPTQKEYALNVHYPEYSFFSKNFNMEENDKPIQTDVPLVPISSDKSILLENVFFDLNAATLRKESFVELNKLVDFLKNNSSVKIEIGGHTDVRGDKNLNQKLSEDRAKSVYEYLVKAGISESRLTHKGYGAEQPIHTEEEIAKRKEEDKEKAHQENRRTAYRIIQ